MGLLIGIDPGLSGAVAVLDEAGKFVAVHDTPTLQYRTAAKNGKQRHDYLLGSMVQVLDQYHDVVVAGIEAAGIQPRMLNGQAVQKGQMSLLHIGRGVGLWQGIMAALEIPFVVIQPAVWKRQFKLLGQEKKASLILAQQRWPTAGLTLQKHIGRSDALFLAEYTRLQHQTGALTAAVEGEALHG
jgi:crossover junction endodeoxyribonuclease RuvC